jgi:hypothetical protein
MTDIDNIEASERILAHLHEGRLSQRMWHRKQDGRELACVLGAISPKISASTDCPASVMPHWLSRLVVPMFDYQTEDAAMTWAGRFGQQMAQWHRLDSAAWDRVRAAFCRECVADAKQSAAASSAAAAAWAAAVYWAARTADYAATDYADAAAAAAAAAAADAADAADAETAANAAYQACWVRLATALCDAIDAELAALAAKEEK